jgi:hypothetical protein
MDIQFWLDNAGSLFHQIFMIVMGGLFGLAYLFGTTYNVINIFVYYIFVPSSWLYLISRKTSVWLNAISVLLLFSFLLLPNIRLNSNYLFQKSVDLLNWTAVIFGSNYIDMSVYICVVVIGVVYLVLIPLTLPKKISKTILIFIAGTFIVYMIFIYPNFKDIMIMVIDRLKIKAVIM